MGDCGIKYATSRKGNVGCGLCMSGYCNNAWAILGGIKLVVNHRGSGPIEVLI